MEPGNAQAIREEIVGTLTRKVKNLFIWFSVFLNIGDYLLESAELGRPRCPLLLRVPIPPIQRAA